MSRNYKQPFLAYEWRSFCGEIDIIEIIGRRIAFFNSGIGSWILSRHTDRTLDIGNRISESDIIRKMIKKTVGRQCLVETKDCLISDIQF